MSKKIDFKKILDHFNSSYIEGKHEDPDKYKDIDKEKYEYFYNNKENAIKCLAEFNKIAENIENESLESITYNSWQNSGHFIDYFWIELKKKEAIDIPSSISIFAIKEGIRVVIEVKDRDVKSENYYSLHNEYLKEVINNKDELADKVYWTKRKDKTIEKKDIENIEDDIKKVNEGEYRIIQLGNILTLDELNNMDSSTVLSWINEQVKFLYPYYEKCVESIKQNSTTQDESINEDKEEYSTQQNEVREIKNYEYIECINITTPSNRCKDETSDLGTTGNYEARMQVYKEKGRKSGPSLKQKMDDFFNNFNDNIYTFDKTNLIEYMKSIKFEYEYQIFNKYNSTSKEYWEDKFKQINEFDDSDLVFNIDKHTFDDQNRYYILSKDKIFSEFKGYILLPNISCIKIEKYKEDNNESFKYIFKIDISDDYKPCVDRILDLIEKLKDNDSILYDDIDKTLNNLDRNLIIAGAPGTGKSYNLEEDRKTYFEDRYERVTFYSNYTCNQFVGTYKPKPKTDNDGKEYISYEFVPGPFLRILIDSVNDKENKPYLLIIEEINRANAANVFGDIFQLLDRREDGRSKYKIHISEDMKEYLEEKLDNNIFNDGLYIPSNLYIWCTMNSADQGVYPMDAAFKRRFEFKFTGIDEGQNKIKDIDVKVEWESKEVKWNALRVAINDKLKESRQVKEDKLIGPFFISKQVLESDSKEFNKSFKNKLLMYLYEDICKYDKMIIFDKDYSTFSELIEAYEGGHKVLNIKNLSTDNNDNV